MSSSAARIWKEICGLSSNHVRAQMIERLAGSPEILIALGRVGVYDKTMDWLLAYRRGEMREFPFGPDGYHRDTVQHEKPQWTATYTTPIGSSALIVSPAAKALDYFQQCLELLGISEEEQLTYERLKTAYKRASLRAHPDKGGSKEAFDEVRKAFVYVEKILNRVNPKFTPADAERMTGPVTAERAAAYRAAGAPPALADEPPVTLSAKKLDMNTFNKIFEENRLADPTRDTGYGDWLKSSGGSDEIAIDPRLAGKKVTPQTFETVFRERAAAQHGSTAIQRRLAPEAIVAAGGVELGSDARNFTAAFGSDVQFTDLKEAYTTGATVFQEVADVRVTDRKWRSIDHARAERDAEMARVDPDESARFAAAAAAVEERERQRRMRLAQQDTAQESWAEAMRRRLLVNN